LAQIDFDQLDDHRFPTRGIKAEGKLFFSGTVVNADQDYEKLSFNVAKVTTFMDRHTLIAGFKGGMSLDNNVPYYDQFRAGGFLNLSGLAQDQLRGNNAAVGELVYYYKLFRMKGFAEKVYLGASVETGNTWTDRSDFMTDLIFNGSVFIGVDTLIGPLYVGYGQADGHEGHGFLYLGKTF
jgi:NTE family protein